MTADSKIQDSVCNRVMRKRAKSRKKDASSTKDLTHSFDKNNRLDAKKNMAMRKPNSLARNGIFVCIIWLPTTW